jgi:hypothetical protein
MYWGGIRHDAVDGNAPDQRRATVGRDHAQHLVGIAVGETQETRRRTWSEARSKPVVQTVLVKWRFTAWNPPTK